MSFLKGHKTEYDTVQIQLRIAIDSFLSRGLQLCKLTGTKGTIFHTKKVELPQAWFGT